MNSFAWTSNTFFRFVAVGGSTAVLYFGTLYVLLDCLGWGRRIGIGVAYALAITFHFFSNRHFSFSATGRLVPQVVKYVAVAFVNYLITVVVVEVAAGELGLNTYLGVAMSIVVTVFSGYLFSKYWVFRAKHDFE